LVHIPINLNEFPDEFESLPAGKYVFVIESTEQKPTNDGKSEKLVVKMKVDDPSSPMHGRGMQAHISFKLPILLKQLCLGAGVPFDSNGLDSSALIGKHVQGIVKASTYTDANTQEVKESSNIDKFVFEKK